MKLYALFLSLTLILPAMLLAQDDVSTIFDDLADLEPAPAAAPAPEPAVAQPAPAPSPKPAPAAIELPQQQSPVVYMPGTVVEPAPVKEADIPPVDIEKTLARGKEAYGDDDWDLAQKLFEAVLYTDEYNKEAIKWLKRIASKKTGRERPFFPQLFH